MRSSLPSLVAALAVGSTGVLAGVRRSATPSSARGRARAGSRARRHLSQLRQLTFGGENAEAYWSNDGRPARSSRARARRTPPTRSSRWRPTAADVAPRLAPARAARRARTSCPATAASSTPRRTRRRAEPPKPPDREPGGYVWGVFDRTTSSPRTSTAPTCGASRTARATTPRRSSRRRATGSCSRRRATATSSSTRWRSTAPTCSASRTTSGYDGGAFFSPDGDEDRLARSATRRTRREGGVPRAARERASSSPTSSRSACGRRRQEPRAADDERRGELRPVLHPDGKRIIFAATCTTRRAGTSTSTSSDVDGTGARARDLLQRNAGPHDDFDGFPMFSPDGKRLVFCSNRHNDEAPRDERLRRRLEGLGGRGCPRGPGFARSLGRCASSRPRPRRCAPGTGSHGYAARGFQTTRVAARLLARPCADQPRQEVDGPSSGTQKRFGDVQHVRLRRVAPEERLPLAREQERRRVGPRVEAPPLAPEAEVRPHDGHATRGEPLLGLCERERRGRRLPAASAVTRSVRTTSTGPLASASATPSGQGAAGGAFTKSSRGRQPRGRDLLRRGHGRRDHASASVATRASVSTTPPDGQRSFCGGPPVGRRQPDRQRHHGDPVAPRAEARRLGSRREHRARASSTASARSRSASSRRQTPRVSNASVPNAVPGTEWCARSAGFAVVVALEDEQGLPVRGDRRRARHEVLGEFRLADVVVAEPDAQQQPRAPGARPRRRGRGRTRVPRPRATARLPEPRTVARAAIAPTAPPPNEWPITPRRDRSGLGAGPASEALEALRRGRPHHVVAREPRVRLERGVGGVDDDRPLPRHVLEPRGVERGIRSRRTRAGTRRRGAARGARGDPSDATGFTTCTP